MVVRRLRRQLDRLRPRRASRIWNRSSSPATVAHVEHAHAPRPPGTRTPRKRRHVDWELVACGLDGHEIIGADAAELRPQDRLFARDGGDHRWYRCLRCDSWVALPPPQNPARKYPPDREEIVIPLRGKALRDKVVLRLIAVDRVFHFVVLTLLGVAVLLFASHEATLKDTFYRVLSDLQGGAGGAVQPSPHVGLLHELDRLFSLKVHTLHQVGIVLIAYGVLEGVEAFGLWFMKRWAEYLTFLATAILLPLEVYEISHRASPLKIFGFIINVAIVVYLLFAKRLFGLRGGGKADEELRARDMSWEAIERHTPPYRILDAATGTPVEAGTPS
jgi:uncharacterized membrane protein (DUF2068 family)